MPGSSKRLPWWKGLSSGELVFTLISVLAVAGAIWWLAHGRGHVLGTVFFAIAFVVGLLGLLLIPIYMRRAVIEAPCPSCGVVARRAFQSKDTKYAVPCTNCVAYIRINGDDVIEEPLDAQDGIPFEVPPTRYLPAAKQANRTQFEFKMPAICAACGSSEATQRRKIGNWNRASSDFGALGFMVSVAADVADVPNFSAHDYGAMGQGTLKVAKDPTRTESLDRALDDIKVPVCTKHVKEGLDPLRYDSGKLVFRSYRYYKEFLRLNKIDGAAAKA